MRVNNMVNVFDAANSLEANVIKNLLETEGIEAFISGEYLQGGIGELPAFGLVRVIVSNENEDKARDIIQSWEAGEIKNDSRQWI